MQPYLRLIGSSADLTDPLRSFSAEIIKTSSTAATVRPSELKKKPPSTSISHKVRGRQKDISSGHTFCKLLFQTFEAEISLTFS